MLFSKTNFGLFLGAFIGYNAKSYWKEYNDLKSSIYLSKDFPYALHPYIVPKDVYQFLNMKNITHSNAMPTWFTKQTYLRLKDADSLDEPFKDVAFRTIKLNEGLSEEVADGCLNCILDGFMAMFCLGCTGDPFVTASIHGTSLKNKLP